MHCYIYKLGASVYIEVGFNLKHTCVTRQTTVLHDIKMNNNFVFHRQDWGAIVLIDERFNKSPKYTNGKELLCESER